MRGEALLSTGKLNSETVHYLFSRRLHALSHDFGNSFANNSRWEVLHAYQ